MPEFTRLAQKPSSLAMHRLRAEQDLVTPALRNDPRFQALINDPKNYEPLF